jgi:hypothetical protein
VAVAVHAILMLYWWLSTLSEWFPSPFVMPMDSQLRRVRRRGTAQHLQYGGGGGGREMTYAMPAQRGRLQSSGVDDAPVRLTVSSARWWRTRWGRPRSVPRRLPSLACPPPKPMKRWRSLRFSSSGQEPPGSPSTAAEDSRQREGALCDLQITHGPVLLGKTPWFGSNYLQ